MSLRAASSGRKRALKTHPLTETAEADGPLSTPVRTPFAHFASFKRAEVAAQRPQWGAQRVSSELTRQWKAMGDAERRPFVELAEFDKAQFLQEQNALTAPTERTTASSVSVALNNAVAPAVKREPLPSKRSKPGNEPRQPDTPYICFWKYERPVVVAEYPNMAAPNVSREVGLRWKALQDDERQEWIDLAARDRKRYEDELAAYRKLSNSEKTQSTPAVASVTTADVPSPRAPKSAFQCFLVHNRESLTLLSMTVEEFHSEMSDLWKRMGHKDKQVWLDMAAQDQVRYETEMAALQRPVDVDRSKKRLEELKRAAARMENAPNPPQTALAFFTVAKRRQLQADRPSLKASEVNREVSKAWKAMNAYDRLPFIGDEQRDVERFVREMDALLFINGGVDGDILTATADFDVLADMTAGLSSVYEQLPTNQPATAESLVPPRLGRKAKSALPKRPMTAYNMMYLAKREELMRTYQLSQNECSALCGRMWRQMAETERQQYYRMAAQDKERYLREMEQHRRSKNAGGVTSAKKAAAKAPTTARSKRTDSTGPSTWEAAASGHAAQSFLTRQAPDDFMQRLEQSARAVFDDAFGSHQDVQYDFDMTQATPGFRYYVDSKRSERERWTMDMWVDDWESLAAPHRVLWEELASSEDEIQHHQHAQPSRQTGTRGHQPVHHLGQHNYHHQQQREAEQHRTLVGDLDLLYGLARGASSPRLGET